ncbi:hypothetical protein N7490_004231 [Penicillium lividum]|nr:hypothetical protein N7490_004231 [Penicillium lividum]
MKAISTDETTDLIMRIEALPARINNLGEQARSEQDDPCDDLDYLVFHKYLVVLSAICHARELIGEADEMFRPWLYELLQAATNGIHLRLEEQRVGIKLQGGHR